MEDRAVSVSISLPISLWDYIDEQCGNRMRSKFMRSLIEQHRDNGQAPAETVMIDDSEPSSVPDSKPDNEHTDNNAFNLGDIKY